MNDEQKTSMPKKNSLTVALILVASVSVLPITRAKTALADVPTIAYCDLVREAELNDKKLVRVRAVYIVGFEGSLFFDPACEGKEAWVQFDPSYEKSTKSKLLKRFRNLSNASPVKTAGGGINFPTKRVEILAVGTFDGIRPTQKLGSITLHTGFGHMNSYDYQFTVLRIEDVKPVTEKSPK
jgi:hypothetical protein